MMDYRELLKKYMRGIAEWQCCDGVLHITPSPPHVDWTFTADEIAELDLLSKETESHSDR
jgi:hypothetical protein